jgi:hypothetical protein
MGSGGAGSSSTPPGTAGASGGNDSSVASSGGTSTLGGSSLFTGGSASGGTVGTGTGGRSATGGTAAGGASDGGTSACGAGKLNPNPFGCDFAWGLSDVPGDPSSVDFLQFMTFWVDSAIKADGSLPSCNGCTWLKKMAATNIVPVYYGYFIGYYAHANGIVDGNQCPSNNPSCTNLTNSGATFVRAHRSAIVQAYADYAKQSYTVYSNKPVVWLLEGDFVQFTYTSQPNALSMTEVAQLAADITCAIKNNMPNAVVGINHSTWNANDVTNAYWNAMKTVGVSFDFAWTTGVANNNGFFNGDTNSSSYNGATATYAYLHQISGKKILVDDGCGGNTNEDWAPGSASTLNARIASGVMAFTHCGNLESNYKSQVAALKSQLKTTCDP